VIKLGAEQDGDKDDHHRYKRLVVLSTLLIGVAELCQVIFLSRGYWKLRPDAPSLPSMVTGLPLW
jgi:hypothetical protein